MKLQNEQQVGEYSQDNTTESGYTPDTNGLRYLA
jgi:hypothetical protein